MGNFTKWLTAIIILGLVALFVQFTPWGGKANSVAMGDSVRSAISGTGIGNITTDMKGNVAHLSGSVASNEAKNTILSAARNAQCDRCKDRKTGKRWHRVDATDLNVKQMASISPYTLHGVRTENDDVILDGYVSSAAAKEQLLAQARTLFSGDVVDREIKIAAGVPNAGWLAVAGANLAGLSKLDTGEFVMEDLNSVLRGNASSSELRTGINASIDGLPSPYNGAANIIVPNVAAENTGQIKSETICQKLFASLKGDNKINFAYNRAEIRGQASLDLLGTMASAASQCSSFRISVEGHTDSDGANEYNVALSQRRALAVVEYLVSRGVNPASVSAIGYGESRPIASNATPAGMAKNRRIEFKVTQSK